MSRNNQERSGARASDPAPPSPPAVNSSDSTFSFSTPTEFVELPSGGQYYSEEHPLHGKDSIEIRFMTAKDEDILSSKTLLKKGIAIDRLLRNIIVDKSINPDTLYVGDKNAVLVATRITGYGPQYTTRTTCPNCTSTTDFDFDLSELPVYRGDDWEDFEIRATGTDRFIITLPQSKVEAEVRLLTGKDEKYLVTLLANKKKQKLPEANLTDQLKMLVVSVNGHTDAKSIQNFIDHLPARDSRYLRSAYEKVLPDVDMKQLFVCDACSFEQEVSVPFTAEFFWPRR